MSTIQNPTHRENAAFAPDAMHELARIMREIADRLEAGRDTGKVRDVNGNSVGSYSLDDGA